MDINVRLFDEETDLDKIDSFLQSKKESFGYNYKNSVEWFLWKFLKSPYGKSIMSSAIVGDEILGSNYYGQYKLKRQNKLIKTIMPYEAFVHQSCQGKGVFKDLISLSENIAKQTGRELMLAFPNNKSLNGFLSLKWQYLPNFVEYWIKPINMIKVGLNALDLKKKFNPNKHLKRNDFIFNEPVNGFYKDETHGYWSKEYLDWRFNKLPQAEYTYLKNENYTLLARLGMRGELKEAQILYLDSMEKEINRNLFKDILKKLAIETQSDFISFPISQHYPVQKHLKQFLFFKLPSKTNFTYRIINEDLKNVDFKFSLCGLDFHTY